MQRKSLLAILILLVSAIVTACSDGSKVATPDENLYAVDPVLREFYSLLGGQDVLGTVISPAIHKNGVVYQYVMAGEMAFDPKAPMTRKFHLVPLGQELGIGVSSDTHWQVAPSFQNMYASLKGEAFVGEPLTSLMYNAVEDRYEQYFENLGFYQGPETNGQVRLLPYGAWRCGEDCRNFLPQNAAPLMQAPTSQQPTAQPTSMETPQPGVTAQPLLATPSATLQPEESHTVLAQSPVLLLPLVYKSSSQASAEPIPADAPTLAYPAPVEEQAPSASAVPEAKQAKPTPPPTPAPPHHRWLMNIWKRYEQLTVKQAQQISVEIKQDGLPYAGALASLLLQMPDGTSVYLKFPPTDAQGVASLEFESIQAKNGTEIPYQVCFLNSSGDEYCMQDRFAIIKKRK